MSTKWTDACARPFRLSRSVVLDVDAHALYAGVDQRDRKFRYRVLGLDENVLAVVDLDLVLGGQCALEAVAHVLRDAVLRASVLDRHFNRRHLPAHRCDREPDRAVRVRTLADLDPPGMGWLDV